MAVPRLGVHFGRIPAGMAVYFPVYQMDLTGAKGAALLAYRLATKLIQFSPKQVVKPYISNAFYEDGVYFAV